MEVTEINGISITLKQERKVVRRRMSKKTFDFSGYATRVDLKCSDGAIIREDAFKHQNGETVPLVWQHLHNGP